MYNAQLQKTIVLPSQPHSSENLDAAIPLQSADTELEKAIELRTTATQIAAPKPDLSAKAEKDDFAAPFRGIFKGKSSVPKCRKICPSTIRNLDSATPMRFATFPHAATAARSLYAATPLRSAEASATHDARRSRFDAALAMHKVPQHMQTTIGDHQWIHKKPPWKLQFQCQPAQFELAISTQTDDA